MSETFLRRAVLLFFGVATFAQCFVFMIRLDSETHKTVPDNEVIIVAAGDESSELLREKIAAVKISDWVYWPFGWLYMISCVCSMFGMTFLLELLRQTRSGR